MRVDLNAHDVATLAIVSIAVADIIEAQEVEPDILDELHVLSPKLNQIIANIQKKSPIYHRHAKQGI